MILRSTPSSPFARKVRIAVAVLGMADKIALQETDLNDPADSIRKQNPLGKIPALVLNDGATLYDSRVILDYLDHLAGGGRIIPRAAPARYDALRLQALCDGALDASVLIVYEGRYRKENQRVQAWVDRQAGKIKRTLDALEATPPPLDSLPNVGQIALACLLGYCDLRFAGDWRKTRPKLVAWLDKFAEQVSAFAETKVAA
jgi:glutathione S-transferase